MLAPRAPVTIVDTCLPLYCPPPPPLVSWARSAIVPTSATTAASELVADTARVRWLLLGGTSIAYVPPRCDVRVQ